jgi:hypothetical protein
MLRGGWITVSEASMMAAVHPSRIWHWCTAAGFDPTAARERRVSIYYARQLLELELRDRVRGKQLAPNMLANTRSRGKRQMSKAALRALANDKIIDFARAGGKIKRIPKGKRGHDKPL